MFFFTWKDPLCEGITLLEYWHLVGLQVQIPGSWNTVLMNGHWNKHFSWLMISGFLTTWRPPSSTSRSDEILGNLRFRKFRSHQPCGDSHVHHSIRPRAAFWPTKFASYLYKENAVRCQKPPRVTLPAHCLAPNTKKEITVFVFRCVMGLKCNFPNFFWGLEVFGGTKSSAKIIGMGESCFFCSAFCLRHVSILNDQYQDSDI